MRKDHKTQKNFISVAVAPQLHLANDDSAVCFKAAFPTSELKAHRSTYFRKMVRLIICEDNLRFDFPISAHLVISLNVGNLRLALPISLHLV